MTSIETTYMGIPLKSPIVVAASSLSNMTDRIQRAETSGAGAMVIRSLFEEQIQIEQAAISAGEKAFDPQHMQDARIHFPQMDEDAARSHVMWVKKARDVVKMPLIASLNAATPGKWAGYATELARAGVDALELNVYSVAANPEKSGAEIEQELYDIVDSVIAAVDIPVSVKLSPFYTSLAYVAQQLDRRGANALVLFNRFLQPDINIEDFSLRNEHRFSTSDEMRIPLRWTAILYGRVKADLAHSTGIHTAKDAAKAILAGSQVVQVAAALYLNGIEYVEKLNTDLELWMNRYEFETLDDFRGIMSQQRVEDPTPFERAQYVQLLVDEH